MSQNRTVQIIRFSAANHKSLRDHAELVLGPALLKRLTPIPGTTLTDHTLPVIGIFGPNASGKSTIVDALSYVRAAIAHSSTTWQASKFMHRAPFALDPTFAEGTSSYEVEFIHDGNRYSYSFDVAKQGVDREELRVAGTKWRRLLSRDSKDVPVTGTGVVPLGQVARRELALSRAVTLDHPVLAPIGLALIEGIEIAPHGDSFSQRRLQAITDALADSTVTRDDVLTLLQIADIGVRGVAVREEPMPADYLRLLAAIKEVRNETDLAEAGDTEPSDRATPESEPLVMRTLEFDHRGAAGARPLLMHEESSGTVMWLSLAFPALDVLRHGGVLVVDEIDSSLHPHLADTLIGFFQDPESNPYGAQLIFTSHDSHLLSPQGALGLRREQIWFTEKDNDGATELFSLADFPQVKDANVSKRYLEGRYGAVPRTAPALMRRLVMQPESEDLDH